MPASKIASTCSTGAQFVRSLEPTAQGNSIPGFGSASQPSRSLLTVNATHVFGAALVNEARFGRTPAGWRDVSGLAAQSGASSASRTA